MSSLDNIAVLELSVGMYSQPVLCSICDVLTYALSAFEIQEYI